MDAAAYKDEGNKHFTAKNFEAAIESFTKGIELDATNHVLFSNRSGAYAALKKYADAKTDAEKCIDMNSAWPKGYVRLGAALHGQGDLDAAVQAYERGLKIDPSNASLKENLAAVQAEQRRSADPMAKIFGRDALGKIMTNPKLQQFMSQPDYVQMIQTVCANPSMAQMYMKDQRFMVTFMALAGLDLGAADMAGAGAGAGAPEPPKPAEKPKPAPKPELTQAQKVKEDGNAHYKQRDFEGALAKYKEASEIEPKNTTFLLNMTAVYFEEGKYEFCIEEVDKAIEHGRENRADFAIIAKLMTRKASCLEKLDKHQEAVELYKKALLENRNAETLKKLEICQAAYKKKQEEAYIDPELSQKAKEDGNTFFKQDNFPEAVKCYDEAIKRNPTDHILYSNRAHALNKLRAYEDAIKDCDKCIDICPTFAKAYARKGAAYFWTKQFNKALAAYDAGLKVDPTQTECLEGKHRTMAKIQEMATGEGDEEAATRAMMDPEIQEIMQDSYMQMVLGEMQKDPSKVNQFMTDPGISGKINKLIAAGIIRVGNKPQGGMPQR